MTDPRRATHSLHATTAELDGLRTWLRGQMESTAFPQPEQHKIVLAVDEAVSNIIEHAYAQNAEEVIDLEIEVVPDRMTIFIRDSGRTFDPDTVKELVIENHVKNGARRGLGIFLMRRIMDEVHYNFKEGIRNELVLVKQIATEGNQ